MKFSNCEVWKTHLDYQIYKALNHRYQIGLEALNQHLPDFRIEIVYRYIKRQIKLKIFSNTYIFIRQRQLKFNPPIEEIRMKYFSQLKKFISVPIGFHGVVDSDSIFASIVDWYVKILIL